MRILGIDIGGSALKGAPVDTKKGKMLAERYRIDTGAPVSPRKMAGLVREIAEHFDWSGPIGIGFPGVIIGSRIMTAANLHKGFVGTDGAKLFRRATGCPVAITNDAAAAALAEMRFGAGRGFDGKILFLILGTGVGSSVANRGVLYPTEFGHLPFRSRIAEKVVAASVREKKDLTWEHWGDRLTEYIGILERVLWPERIVIGGGVSAKHRKFFRHIRARAKIVPARFLNGAGIIGAALWAAESLRTR